VYVLTSYSTHNRSFWGRAVYVIDLTDTDTQTTSKRKHTKHKNYNPNTNKMASVKTRKLNLKQFTCKKCSYQCACNCAQLWCTTQHRTVL